MGIYIPGIETPKGHNYVTITIWPSGTASYGLFDREENLCDFKSIKAVPVQTNGDLIERDELIKGIEADAIWKYNAINEYDSGIRTGARTVMRSIRNAPTIIPASKSE